MNGEDEDKLAEGQRVVLCPSTFAPDKKGAINMYIYIYMYKKYVEISNSDRKKYMKYKNGRGGRGQASRGAARRALPDKKGARLIYIYVHVCMKHTSKY